MPPARARSRPARSSRFAEGRAAVAHRRRPPASPTAGFEAMRFVCCRWINHDPSSPLRRRIERLRRRVVVATALVRAHRGKFAAAPWRAHVRRRILAVSGDAPLLFRRKLLRCERHREHDGVAGVAACDCVASGAPGQAVSGGARHVTIAPWRVLPAPPIARESSTVTAESQYARFGSGKSVPPRRGRSAADRRWPIRRRLFAARPGVRLLPAFAARACAHRCDRQPRRRGHARRDRDRHRRRSGPRRRRAAAAVGRFQARRRLADGVAAAARAGVGTVRFVGEAVAAVVAQSAQQARDAAEAIDVRYDPLPAVIDATAAVAAGRAAGLARGSRQHRLRSAARRRRGDRRGLRPRRAPWSSLDLVNQRVAPVPDRAARRARELRRDDRADHAARELPDADRIARRSLPGRARHSRPTRCGCWSATSAAASA